MKHSQVFLGIKSVTMSITAVYVCAQVQCTAASYSFLANYHKGQGVDVYGTP